MTDICMVLIDNIRYDGRVRKEIGTLVRAGHQVELIVSDYGRTGSGGEELGINIHYIPMRLWSQSSMNLLEKLLFNLKAASIIKKIAPSYIHCHDLDCLLAGVWTKNKIKAQLVFDAHELFPEQWGGMKEKMWSCIERWCIRSCDYIIFPEKNRIAYFKTKYKNIPEPLLLQNFPRKSDILTENPDLFREIYPIERKQNIILCIGTIHPLWRNIEELIDSMTVCGDEFVLVIIGSFTNNRYKDDLYQRIDETGLKSRVFIHDTVPHDEIMRYMASADIGIAFYSNINLNNYYCASNKLYEFIALEKPVLTNDYPGLLQTVECFRQGICLTEVTPKSLVDAYMRACDPELVTPGANKYFWEDEEHILLQLYDK